MKAYVYNAEMFCEECGRAAQEQLASTIPDPAHPPTDSNVYPQGPYENGGGEADTPQHCGDCGEFLQNPLTTDGVEYARETIERDLRQERTASVAVTVWAPFYGIEVAR